jgi:indole-3-glycerol phosphate synthase
MNVLERIIAYKHDEVATRKKERAWDDIDAAIRRQSRPRGFANALREHVDGKALIAEIKKASPSKGLIREDFDPPALAKAYETGGATCLSVLTDAPSFQGHEDFLVAARAACALPVLRKDFMVDAWQIAESRAIGADAILIIMAAVDNALASDLQDAANAYGMDALVEVHDEAEMERALWLGAKLIGVNNRSLATFDTDLAITERLARLQSAGARAFLVGESLMRQADVAAATRALLSG